MGVLLAPALCQIRLARAPRQRARFRWKPYYLRLTSGEAPRIPLFADCVWVDGFPKHDDVAPPGFTLEQGSQQAGINQTYRFIMSRHNKSINLVFADGHGENVPLNG